MLYSNEFRELHERAEDLSYEINQLRRCLAASQRRWNASLESTAIDLMAGKDYHRLSTTESQMLGILVGRGLLEVRNGFVQRVKIT